ncbi:hypothetical protein [Candidatus Mycoplasma haematohominis]|uniref:Uncharacterized protein n=1 Tax=Candidatus Mycoplasma haematohominis TaxID=1494318 RepID=A0A478FTE1_9MOLU|nr:hypothetical protein [Candidatus Mycoplasma haemohominis]GCE63656.1 hypothetical protein MHSWG343_06560 [Candidatus Mycoplasma haemohominis]
MSALTKAAIGGGAVLAVSSGGYGMSFLFRGIMPDFSTLEEQEITTYDTSKYAKDFKPFFIDDVFEDNQKWWDWSYNTRWLEDNSDSSSMKAKKKFQGVTGGYKDKDGSDTNSLKQKCKEAYGANSNGDVLDSTDATDKFETKDIWRYCSIKGVKPVLVSGYATTKFGGKTGLAESLVSVKDEHKESNDWFWEIREREFRVGVKTKSKKTQEPAGTKAKTGKKFDLLYKNEKNRTVKELCREIYETNQNDGSTKNIEESDIKRFCFLTPVTTDN